VKRVLHFSNRRLDAELDEFRRFHLERIVQALAALGLGHWLEVSRDTAQLLGQGEFLVLLNVEALVKPPRFPRLGKRPRTAIQVAATAFRTTKFTKPTLAGMHARAFTLVGTHFLYIGKNGRIERHTQIQQDITSAKRTIFRLLAFFQAKYLVVHHQAKELGDRCLIGKIQRRYIGRGSVAEIRGLGDVTAECGRALAAGGGAALVQRTRACGILVT